MKRVSLALLAATISLAGCAKPPPTQAQLELAAFNRVLEEKVAEKKMTQSEAALASQQYAGAIRARESGIAASYGVANSNNTYATNSSMALGMAMMCAGQRGGHC